MKGLKLGKYRILFYIDENDYVVLKDWSTDYSEFTINLSEKLTEAGKVGFIKGKIRFELQPNEENGVSTKSYIGIEEIVLSAPSETDERIIEFLDSVSIYDANKAVGKNRNDDGTYDNDYWQASGNRLISKAKVTYVDFVYDVYNAKLGLKTVDIGKSTFDDYIKAGYCKLNYATGEFEVLMYFSLMCTFIF